MRAAIKIVVNGIGIYVSARLQIQNFWPALIGGVIAITVPLVLHAALPAAKNYRSLTKEMA